MMESMEKIGFCSSDDIVFTHVKKYRFAYVLNNHDYVKNKKTFQQYFSDIGLILCGRFSSYEYLNMDKCIESAAYVAEKHFQQKQ